MSKSTTYYFFIKESNFEGFYNDCEIPTDLQLLSFAGKKRYMTDAIDTVGDATDSARLFELPIDSTIIGDKEVGIFGKLICTISSGLLSYKVDWNVDQSKCYESFLSFYNENDKEMAAFLFSLKRDRTISSLDI